MRRIRSALTLTGRGVGSPVAARHALGLCAFLALVTPGCGAERPGPGAEGSGAEIPAAAPDSARPASPERAPPSRPEAATGSTGEDTLTVLYIGDERILSPIWDMPSKLLVFQTLVERDHDWRVQGLLARSWDHSEDYRRWTVHLRTDVRWHDGEPFTARDVAFTYRLLQHPEVAFVAPETVEVEAVDDSTVRFRYPGSSPGTPLETYRSIFPEHLLDEKDPARFGEWEFWTRPVGTGPYRYVRHVPRTMVELEANPDYFRGEPAIDRLILKLAPAAASGLVELRAGNVDVLGWPDRMEVLKARGDDRFRIYHNLNPQWTRLIVWNTNDPRLGRASVRRALTHALDRRELLRVLDLPPDLPLADGVPTRGQYLRGELPQPLAHDPARARRLLARAGWRDTDGDGVRERDGRELRFTLLTRAEGRPAAVFVQDRLAAVGVRAEVRVMEPSVIGDRWRSGEFEALLDRVAPETLSRLVGEDAGTGFRHERARALMDEIREAGPDRTRRDSLFRELMDVFRQEQPATFLFPQVHRIVAHRRVKGLSSPYRAFVLMEAEHLWIAGEDESPASAGGGAGR